MILFIQKQSVVIFLCIFFMITDGFAATRGAEKVYNIPLSEMEEIISSRLRNSGFDIYRTLLQMGQVKLYAENKKESWLII